jgi:hypothetical protein
LRLARQWGHGPPIGRCEVTLLEQLFQAEQVDAALALCDSLGQFENRSVSANRTQAGTGPTCVNLMLAQVAMHP